MKFPYRIFKLRTLSKSKSIYVLIAILISFTHGLLWANNDSSKVVFNPKFCAQEEKNKEYEAYKNAWAYYYKGNNEKALHIVKKYKKLDSAYRERWIILLATIYFKQDQYQDVLNATNSVRPVIEKAFAEMNKKHNTVTSDVRQDIEFIYYKMLGASGSANYYLGNYTAALKDLLIFVKENPSATLYDVIAICYYRDEQYTKAIDYLIRSFQLHDDRELKDTAAYNIGVLSALLGNVGEAIHWLEIPLKHNRKMWIEKIKADKDFDVVRNDKQFNEFLRQQEQLKSGRKRKEKGSALDIGH